MDCGKATSNVQRKGPIIFRGGKWIHLSKEVGCSISHWVQDRPLVGFLAPQPQEKMAVSVTCSDSQSAVAADKHPRILMVTLTLTQFYLYSNKSQPNLSQSNFHIEQVYSLIYTKPTFPHEHHLTLERKNSSLTRRNLSRSR